MAFGKKCDWNVNRANEDYGMGLVRSSSFGRKRIVPSNVCLDFDDDVCINPTKPSKRRCFQDSFFCAEKSTLEDLPQEILIRILCGVEHDDLKSLFFVSKAMREAGLIAKQTHFAYSTPRKTTKFRSVEDSGDFNEVETPDAPRQSGVRRSRLSSKRLADISVSLFASDSEDVWPRKGHFSGYGNRDLIVV